MSKLKVRLSEIAQQRLLEILLYIEIEWPAKSKKKFLKKFDEKIDQISRLPKSCPESHSESGLFRGVVEKHVSLIY